MVAVAIIAVLAALAIPAFSGWILNSRIRATADGIKNGLSLTRAEAIRRNTRVRFQLTSTLDNACAPSLNGLNWIISLDDPTGLCDLAPSDAVPPRTFQSKPAGEDAGRSVAVVTDQSTIIFNGVGRSTLAATFDVSSVAGVNCVTAGGTARCMRVTVTPGGQVRMCDPARPAPPADPQGC
jgi:type IV fimbrial biogenesis protein FimT